MRNKTNGCCSICGEQTTNLVLVSNKPRFMCKKHLYNYDEITNYLQKQSEDER